MKNKVLVQIVVPDLDEKYDILLPISKKIGEIIILVNKAILEMKKGNYKSNDNAKLYNTLTGISYQPDTVLIDTDIRNGSVLVLI